MSTEPAQMDVMFRNMLIGAGFDFANPDPIMGLEVFRHFTEIPIYGITSDGLLFECGVFDFGTGADFTFDLCRQIQFPGDYEYFQLHCTFMCAPNPQVKDLQTVLWSFAEDLPGKRHDGSFFSDAMALTEFQSGIQQKFTSCEVIMFKTG